MYKNVVVGVELNQKTDSLLIAHCKKMFDDKTKITLVHAVEHLGGYGGIYNMAAGINIDSIIYEEASKELTKVAKLLHVKEADQFVKNGPAKTVIVDVAKDIKADLIVVGSHGRHGMQLLLGATANGVLHQALCDVLSVRVD